MSTTAFLLMVAVVLLTAVSGFAQHRYYARTVRRLAREHADPGLVLVSGRGKSRLRGAIAVLVVGKDDEVIRAAKVMEGASVLARFKDRPDWVGRSTRDDLPGSSPRVRAAVAEARSQMPRRRRSAPLPPRRPAAAPRRGARDVDAAPRRGGRDVDAST